MKTSYFSHEAPSICDHGDHQNRYFKLNRDFLLIPYQMVCHERKIRKCNPNIKKRGLAEHALEVVSQGQQLLIKLNWWMQLLS